MNRIGSMPNPGEMSETSSPLLEPWSSPVSRGFTNPEQTFKRRANVVPSMNYPILLESAKGLPDIFELVKRAVESDVGYARGGLMLALADLGNHPHGFIGALYPLAR